MSNQLIDAPRPSSLRALVAWFFVLSFGDYKDELDRSGDDENYKIEGQFPFERRLKQLVWWPPDVFAVTSSALLRTGAYRMIVGPDRALGQDLWQQLDWPERVEAHAEAWRSIISRYLLKPFEVDSHVENPQILADSKMWGKLNEKIKERCKRRRLEQSVKDETLLEGFINNIVTLRDENGPLADQNLLAVSVKADNFRQTGHQSLLPAAKFVEAIIGLHILADAASGSIGVPRSSTQESAVFDAFANIMLTLRGSLSTAPKFLGAVLPKMRTPQMGLTLRNLSHNLTYHDCEVEVMWRSFPWANFDENTLNVLYVPYPFDFDAKRFQGDTEHYESVGYFSYDPGDWKEIGSIVALIKEVQKKGIAPHLLAFTETAFNEVTYNKLLEVLSENYGSGDPRFMPVVVAGISRKDAKGQNYNELRLATHFAGKWYQLEQHKHHRWQLNEHQIRQYGLQGHLSTARPLFERIVVGQRRLTFYAPTPWLVLCPLICEDLARIEPASELIRGVGPTLVLALLLDGPQLDGRWPTKYASVLADDPGTGVLTVTSYGAANASRPASSVVSPVATTSDERVEVVVASWKDPSSTLLTLPAAQGEALLITLTAHSAQEYTLDRRVSSTKAASFRVDGVKTFNVPNATVSAQSMPDPRGDWSDIREVTAMTYVASAALSLLRPHHSEHPLRADDYSDTWTRMWDWNRRCLRVRQLIDVMLGCPVLMNPDDWASQTNEEAGKLTESARPYFTRLKAKRNALLKNLFSTSSNTIQAHNRHLYSVLGFAQSTVDVQVRAEETQWPTNSLRYACTVMRLLLDTIAGVDVKMVFTEHEPKTLGAVYSSRLRIAGIANRLDKHTNCDECLDISGGVDVPEAPKTLLSYQDDRLKQVKYLNQFLHKRLPLDPGGRPNHYDFFRMILELIDAILVDNEASLWRRAGSLFSHDDAQEPVNHKERRRLTLLILMMVTALIREQLEFNYVRLKHKSQTALSGQTMHFLMTKAQEILTKAAVKSRASAIPTNDSQP